MGLIQYFKDSFYELGNVTWPSQEDLIKMTAMVIISVIISSFLLGGVDYVFTSGYRYLLSISG